MTTAEAAQAALGPRYAPDDPDLPTPWKGLIDGSTGLLYYWNPETNITQYEKPVPLPSGPALAASTPNLAPIPVAHSAAHGGMVGQHGQQSLQSSQQQRGHLAQQHGQMMPQQQSSHVAHASQQQPSQASQAVPQQNSQLVQSMPQPGLNQAGQYSMQPHGQHSMQPLGQHSMQPQGQHSMQPQGQHSMQPQGQHSMQPQGQQMHYQMQPQVTNAQNFGQGTSQAHGSHQPPAHQFTPQNMHYMSYQQNSQQMQHNIHGHPFENQQDFKPTFPKTEEVEFKNESQVGVSPSKYQQRNTLSVESNQNISAGISSGPSSQVPHAGINAGQPKQFSVQQSPSAMPLQQGSSYSAYQHGPSFQNQMGPGMMHGQPPSVHPVGQKMGHGDNLHGRAGNEYYYNSGKDMPTMGPQQPSIAQIPISTKQQEMRMGNAPFQNVMPSGNGSGVPGHAMRSMFTPPIGGHAPLSSNSLTGPPYIGSSDVSDLTPAEIYCQQHEVTATGDNVPPPFMTFDATGFPPEILREVRYLLQSRSICRTLHC